MMPAAQTMVQRDPGRAEAEIGIREEYGWLRFVHGEVTVWFKGWIDGLDAASLAARFAQERPSAKAIGDQCGVSSK